MSEEEALSSTRRQRIRVRLLLFVLLGAWAFLSADRLGWVSFIWPAPFSGERRLPHDVLVEQVDLSSPVARLVVARIPRNKGLGVRAAILVPETPQLAHLGPFAQSAGALVAINGDYHRLGGHCRASPYSTLIEDGQLRTVGSPFSYACSFWLDAQGAPHMGRLDLSLEITFPNAQPQPLWLGLHSGPLALIARPPAGEWGAKGFVGVAVTLPERLEKGELVVRGEAGARHEGPALLAQGSQAALLAHLRPGDRLTLRTKGGDQGAPLAIGTGPRLLEGGEVHPDARLVSPGWTLRLPRSGLGFDGHTLYLVVTLDAPRAGLSMQNFALAMRRLGCQEALNLDGGPSTFLWAQGPTRNAGTDDPVACGLLVFPPGTATPLR
jgi:hypothetical protein